MEADRIRALRDFIKPQVPPELVEAIGAEIARHDAMGFSPQQAESAVEMGIPYLGGLDASEVASQVHAGEGPLFDKMNGALDLGNPMYKPENKFQKFIQDKLLSDYTGVGWLPSQVEALGRDPGYKEMSPGGRMAHELSARADFIRRKGADYEGYQDTLNNPNSGYDLQELAYDMQNPETYLGTFNTKMNGVLADAASFVGDWMNGADTDGAGNAAIRSGGADFFRKYPPLTSEDGDWRSRDQLIRDGRRAYAESQGMNANDFIQRFFNKDGVSYQQNPFSNVTSGTVVSLGNSALDGTYGGSKKQIIEELATDVIPVTAFSAMPLVDSLPNIPAILDGAVEDVMDGNGREVWNQFKSYWGNPDNYLGRPEDVPTPEENMERFEKDDQSRNQAVKTLEQINSKIRHPQQEMFDKAKSVAAKAVSSYRAPLGNAIPW